jgi:UDP-glucose:(heptosyl)LPS alpha-1,3-glucosyltransferase
MPGLDIYYAADSCYEEKARTQRNRLYRLIPRYRLFSRFERAVFGQSSQTEILMISEVQKPLFRKYYNTQMERFHALPPGISRDRAAPANSEEIRAVLRHEFEVRDDETLLLMVGSGFITKGLDRILLGMRALPSPVRRNTRLIVIGQDAPAAFERMAALLGIKDRVLILKGRDDIPRFLLGADFLIHPAYVENTGTVILEAMVAGLPVLATDICGYAHYISEAGAGDLVPSPFEQDTFNELLHNMIISDNRMSWKKGGLDYASVADIYSMPERAADFIAETINWKVGRKLTTQRPKTDPESPVISPDFHQPNSN